MFINVIYDCVEEVGQHHLVLWFIVHTDHGNG